MTRIVCCIDCGVEFEAAAKGRPAERCPEHRTARLVVLNQRSKERRKSIHCKHPDSCQRPAHTDGWCGMHAYRLQRYGDAGPVGKKPVRDRYQYETGYILIRVGHGRGRKGLRYEHHVVMEQMLGRPLRKSENVHHKNGNRADNRPENLELWVKPQPFGQRPEDLAAWVVDQYPDLVRAALAARDTT